MTVVEILAGRYLLVDALGSGGMGTVWRVWDLTDQCYVAAKVLRASDAVSLQRFMQEQGLRVNHPHVLAPRGWAGLDDRVLFTMELVPGDSLARLLGDFAALPPAWAALLLDQLLAALEAVASEGIVHRDVKPANLLLRPTGRGRPHLLLGDFGAATRAGSPRLTEAAVVLGTPGFVAPEQLAGADPDPRQDLYAAGMVAVEMLHGERWDGAAAAPLPPLPGGEALRTVVSGLVARDPGHRFPSATHARAALAITGLVPAEGEVPDDDGLEIEVFDHAPPLPQGFGPTGPSRAVLASAPARPSAPGPDGPHAGPTKLFRHRRRLVAGATLATAVALTVGVVSSGALTDGTTTPSPAVVIPSRDGTTSSPRKLPTAVLSTRAAQDVLARDRSGTIYVGRNSSGRLGAPRQLSTAFAGYARLSRADLDGDGFDDVLARDSGGRLHAARNNRSGGFGPLRLTLATDNTYTWVGGADCDGDGDADIVGVKGKQLHLWRNNSTKLAKPKVLDDHGYRYAWLDSADLNGDGYDDIIASTDGRMMAFYNDNHGDFSSHHRLSNHGYHYSSLATADVNGDGYDDVLGKQPGQRPQIFYADTRGNLLPHADLPGNGYADYVALL